MVNPMKNENEGGANGVGHIQYVQGGSKSKALSSGGIGSVGGTHCRTCAASTAFPAEVAAGSRGRTRARCYRRPAAAVVAVAADGRMPVAVDRLIAAAADSTAVGAVGSKGAPGVAEVPGSSVKERWTARSAPQGRLVAVAESYRSGGPPVGGAYRSSGVPPGLR